MQARFTGGREHEAHAAGLVAPSSSPRLAAPRLAAPQQFVTTRSLGRTPGALHTFLGGTTDETGEMRLRVHSSPSRGRAPSVRQRQRLVGWLAGWLRVDLRTLVIIAHATWKVTGVHSSLRLRGCSVQPPCSNASKSKSRRSDRTKVRFRRSGVSPLGLYMVHLPHPLDVCQCSVQYRDLILCGSCRLSQSPRNKVGCGFFSWDFR